MARNTPGGTIMSSEGAVVVAVSSPFAGAIPTEALNLCMGDRGQASQLRNVRLGIINPGRSRLTNLSTDEVMWWRLWDIAAAGNDHELELLILPGPRLRPGTRLPDGFPFQFVGLLTRSWSSVAILLAPEIADCVRHLSTVGDDRRLWFLIQSCDGALPWLLCAVYGPPGGDVAFFVNTHCGEVCDLVRRTLLAHDHCGRCDHTAVQSSATVLVLPLQTIGC